jgi:hypothetical protein
MRIWSLLLLTPVLSAETTWREVKPILERRCVQCHQAGEVAPMAFTSYREARPFAKAMRQAVARQTMPPWHAATGSMAFRNDRSLTAAEVATLTAWAEGGALEGKPAAAMTVATAGKKWKLGTPDRVVQVPGFQVPATGQLQYSFLVVPLNLREDTWVRAAEFRIDQRGVVHHINAFVRPPGSSYLAEFPKNEIFSPTVAQRAKRKDSERVFDRRQLVLGYEPGYEPMPWLENGAKLVPAGSDLVLEMHYNPNGKPTTDRSEFGLYFATVTPKERVVAIDTLRDLDFVIPPQVGDFVSQAVMTMERPARLLSVQPHMHMRGKSMRVRAVYPDGRTETVIDVPRYDFNWQTTYVLAKPLELPQGTRLESTAGFDNSPNNRFNPDAKASVKWGDQTTDEMHIAFLELVIEADGDPEKLFKTVPKMVGAPATTR